MTRTLKYYLIYSLLILGSIAIMATSYTRIGYTEISLFAPGFILVMYYMLWPKSVGTSDIYRPLFPDDPAKNAHINAIRSAKIPEYLRIETENLLKNFLPEIKLWLKINMFNDPRIFIKTDKDTVYVSSTLVYQLNNQGIVTLFMRELGHVVLKSEQKRTWTRHLCALLVATSLSLDFMFIWLPVLGLSFLLYRTVHRWTEFDADNFALQHGGRERILDLLKTLETLKSRQPDIEDQALLININPSLEERAKRLSR